MAVVVEPVVRVLNHSLSRAFVQLNGIGHLRQPPFALRIIYATAPTAEGQTFLSALRERFGGTSCSVYTRTPLVRVWPTKQERRSDMDKLKSKAGTCGPYPAPGCSAEFWMVLNPEGYAPRVKHLTEISAREEAERLARALS